MTKGRALEIPPCHEIVQHFIPAGRQSDNETLMAIEEGLQDIKAGKVIKFEDFLKKHGYET